MLFKDILIIFCFFWEKTPYSSFCTFLFTFDGYRSWIMFDFNFFLCSLSMTSNLLFSWRSSYRYVGWTKNDTNIPRWQCDFNSLCEFNSFDISLHLENQRVKVRMDQTSTWVVHIPSLVCSSFSSSINNKLLIKINLKNWK